EREKIRAEAKTISRVGQPGRSHHENKAPRVRAGPSEAIRQSIEIDSSTTKNDYNQGNPGITRKRKATSQPPPSKRRKRNPDKSYNPENDQDDDGNSMNEGKRTKHHTAAPPPSSPKRGGSIFKDFGENTGDDENDGKKKGRKRL